MSGRFLVETNDYPHECNAPMCGPRHDEEPEAGIGSVWECECGRRYIVRLSWLESRGWRRNATTWKRLRWWRRPAEGGAS